MTELFDSTTINDDPEYWDSLAARVATGAVARPAGRNLLTAFVASKSSWIATTVAVGTVAAGIAAIVLQQEAPIATVVEDLRITSNESSRVTGLTLVSSMTVLSDGSMVLFHGRRISWRQGGMAIRGSGGTVTEHTMRVFDPTGRFVRMFGGGGDGPGEFKGMGLAGSIGDNVWAIDFNNSRETVLSRDGRVLRTSTRPGDQYATTPQLSKANRVRGLLAGNRRLMSHSFTPRTPPTDPLATVPEPDSVVFTIEDSLGRTITRIASDPTYKYQTIRAMVGRYRWQQQQDFAGTVMASIADGGAIAVVASDAEVWGGRPGQVRLQVVGPDSRVAEQIVSLPPRRIPRDYIDSFVARGNQPAADQAQMRAALQKLYLPEYYPVLGELKVGRDGSIWISHVYEPNIWTVVHNGRVVMRVRIPEQNTVMAVSLAQVWAVREDVSGLPIVIRYSVKPARG